MTRTSKGFATIVVLAVLALAGVVAYPSLKFHLFSKKPPVAQLDKAQLELANARAAAASAEAALAATQEAERAKQVEQVRHAQEMGAGATEALHRAPPSPEVKLAGDLLDRSNIALALAVGSLPDDKRDEILRIVNGALSQVQAERDAAQAALRAKDAELIAVTHDRDVAKAQIPVLLSKVQQTDAKVSAAEVKTQSLTNQVSQWAKAKVESDGKASSLSTQVSHLLLLLALIAGIWLLAPVLSSLAKVFPALGGVAHGVNSVLSFALSRQSKQLQQTIVANETAVGNALGEIRATVPEAATKVRDIFDKHIPEAQQPAIGAVADAAHGKILGSQ